MEENPTLLISILEDLRRQISDGISALREERQIELNNIRTELALFHGDVSNWNQTIGERIAKVETNVESGITGTSTSPSRVYELENSVRELQRTKWTAAGVTGAIGTILGVLGTILTHMLAHIHGK